MLHIALKTANMGYDVNVSCNVYIKSVKHTQRHHCIQNTDNNYEYRTTASDKILVAANVITKN